MKVLITNHALAERAGSELYVKEISEALLRRGHTPIAYSTKLGGVAAELRKATVPVVDDLASVSIPPDIIHGQHHVETMSALLHFPGVPAVYFCHGWLAWEEAPPKFPRIIRYVAVDDTCRDRLIYEQGLPESQVSVIRNFVDLETFKTRAPLPDQPKRALVFSNHARDGSHLDVIRKACEGAGIELDEAGLDSEAVTTTPENLLPKYDVVFAKARCAFEAMAVGTAVILCDAPGLGPMVTTGELEELKRFNFGVRTLRDPVCVEGVAKQLKRYDPRDALEVSRQIRSDSGMESAVDQIIDLYESVIADYKSRSLNGNNGCGSQTATESQYTAAYLRGIAEHLTRQREAIYDSTSYRIGNFIVRAPLVGNLVKKVLKRSE